MAHASILWRRVDAPGHDSCRLEELEDGWRLDGAAVFLHEGAPARLDYRVECARDWSARGGEVRGWVGSRSIRHVVARSGGGWTLDGAQASAAARGLDLDLAFTPATNLIALRRLDLAIGASAEAPAAWLDPMAGTLELLEQRYARRSAEEYEYESRSGYSAVLVVTSDGFVRHYPGLWSSES